MNKANETRQNPITHPPLKATTNADCKEVPFCKLIAAIYVTLTLALVATYIPIYPQKIEVQHPKTNATAVYAENFDSFTESITIRMILNTTINMAKYKYSWNKNVLAP